MWLAVGRVQLWTGLKESLQWKKLRGNRQWRPSWAALPSSTQTNRAGGTNSLTWWYVCGCGRAWGGVLVCGFEVLVLSIYRRTWLRKISRSRLSWHSSRSVIISGNIRTQKTHTETPKHRLHHDANSVIKHKIYSLCFAVSFSLLLSFLLSLSLLVVVPPSRLCSDQDPSGLLLLPPKGAPADFDISPILNVMDTLLLVATREVCRKPHTNCKDQAVFVLPATVYFE